MALISGATACAGGQVGAGGGQAPSAPPIVVASANAPAAPVVEEPLARGLDPRDAGQIPGAVDAEVAFREAGETLGVAALGRRALDERGVLDGAALEKLRATGVTEERLLGWVLGMAPACRVPEGARAVPPCVGAPAGEPGGRELFRRAIAAAGASGSLRSARVLVRLAAGGLGDTTEALAVLLRRRGATNPTAKACPPPNETQIAAEEKQLDDFLVLEEGPKALRARTLTSTERADLAYFFASIGPAHAREITAPRDVAAPSLEADRKAQLAALAEGDLESARTIARASFAAWGLDGPSKGSDGVPPAMLAPFALDAGVVFELLGNYPEAARAYRASAGARAKTRGERPIFGQLDRREALLRADEASGSCADTVWPRLRRGLLRPLPEVGTERLKANGFDVARLYRGGLLTAYRTASLDTRALLGLTPAQRTTFAARAAARGPEDFDDRGRLLEGLAETLGASAIAPLLATALDKTKGPDLRGRSIAVLGALLREPEVDPCREPAPFQSQHAYERALGSLNAVCATRLPNEESKRIATELGQLSSDPDKDLRWSAVVALDAFERDPKSPALGRFLRDAFTAPGAPPEERRPVAALAQRALFRRAPRP